MTCCMIYARCSLHDLLKYSLLQRRLMSCAFSKLQFSEGEKYLKIVTLDVMSNFPFLICKDIIKVKYYYIV